MKFIGSIRKKKYFYKIISLFTAVLFSIMSIFAFTVYYNIEKNVMKNEYDYNKKFLYQVKYNVDFINEMARNLCIFNYFKPDIKALMYYRGEEEYYNRHMESLRKVSNITEAIPLVDSIYIYNSELKQYFSDRGVFADETIQKSIVAEYKQIPVLKPVFRSIENSEKLSDEKDYVISYFMYEDKDGSNYMDGGVILNVKTQWLYDNIKMLNMTDVQKDSVIFIANERGEFIKDKGLKGNAQEVSTDDIYHAYKNDVSIDSSQDFGLFKSKINSRDFFITYIKLENTDWVLLKAQPYNQLFQYIRQMKASLLMITGILLLLALAAIISISRNIYSPIANLIRQLNSEQNRKLDTGDFRDEFFYLNQVYKYTNDRLKQFREEKNSNKSIMTLYYLKNLLIDSASMREEDIEKIREEKYFSIDINRPLVVCIIKIDCYPDFEKSCDQGDRGIYKFAIMNIASEVLSEAFKNEMIDMGTDQIAVLSEVSMNAGDYRDKLIALIKKAQEYIYKYYKLSVSFSISETVQSREQIARHYNQALDFISYRCLFGKMSVISHPLVKNNLDNLQFSYPSLLEKRLVEDIRHANIGKIKEDIAKIFDDISSMNYNNIILALMHLLNTIKSALDEINQGKLNTYAIDFGNLIEQLYEMETLEVLKGNLLLIFENIPEEEKDNRSEKNKVLVETIKKVISENYSDSQLCMTEIADMLKMSPQYISRIFRNAADMSISEYINEVRLSKVLDLLKNTNLNISNVLEKVGIENETYFFRLFKKKFGTTPREYLLRMIENRQ